MTPKSNAAWLFLLILMVFGTIVYRDALRPGHVLFTTDDNIGAIAMRKSTIPEAFFGGWDDSILVGQPNNVPVSSTNLFLWLLSPRTFVNWIHWIDLVVGSWFLILFLRLRGVGWMPALLGALLACWFGSTFFLTYAGHIGKFGVVMFAGIYLYLVERAVKERSIPFAIMAGAAMGGMFIEQSDSALFFALVLGPYALFRGWQDFRYKVADHARVVLPLVVVTAMVALHSVYAAYSFYRMDKPAEAEQQSWQELWDYCTQWSWPPAETIEFIAPGYMGWRSGEPTGPYWGALGRSPQWQPQFGPSGMNFKLETFYKGFLPVMFMVLGLYVFVIRRKGDEASRQSMVFWAVATLVTFILACGKYLPAYRLFFELPGISSIRNPVKFMQITQIAMAVLAAYGMDYWLKALKQEPVKNDPDRGLLGGFTRGVFFAAIAFSVFTLILLLQQSSSAAAFASSGWPAEMASAMVKTRVMAMVHLAVMAWIGWALLRLGGISGQIKHTSWRHLGWAVLVVVMVDQLLVSHRYVKSAEAEGLVGEGAMIPILKRDLGTQRAHLWNPPPQVQSPWGGLYNQWMTILFSYHQIPLINLSQMRMPDDYKMFLAAMEGNPLAQWSHMGLGMALTPSDFWAQIRNQTGLRGVFEPVAGFNAVQAKGGVTTAQVFGDQPAHHVLLRYNVPSERYALVGSWRGASLPEAARQLPRLQPLTTVLVDPEATAAWPTSGEPGRAGRVSVTEYRAGRIAMEVDVERPGVLRAAEKFTPDWRAWVNGVEKPVVRTDMIFLGVLMEPTGQPQQVVLEFRPQRVTLYLQFLGMGLAFMALVFVPFMRRPVS